MEANLELLDILLSRVGHRVKGVTSGEAAIVTLRADPDFDLVLMDVQMPGMDGLEATRLIRRLGGRVESLPIVALTANVMAEQVAECRMAGMDEHLTKPVRKEALFEVIDRVGRMAGKAREASETGAAPDVGDPLAALKARYRLQMSTLAAEFARMESLQDPERSREIAALAHSVAGTSGSLGFSAVSTAAFALEAEVRASLTAEPASRALGPLIQTLLAAALAS